MNLCEHSALIDAWLGPQAVAWQSLYCPVVRGADGVKLGGVEIVATQNGDGVNIRCLLRDGQLVTLYVAICGVPVHFGGYRPLVFCPRCARRAGFCTLPGSISGAAGAVGFTTSARLRRGSGKGHGRAEKISRRL